MWATDFEKLPPDRVLQRRDGYLLVRSPGHPDHYWGNLLVFDDPPAAGDGERWERLFEAEFDDEPRVEHRTFAWDRLDGEVGLAREEFVARGYELEDTIGLIAGADEVRAHPRENREVAVRALRCAEGADAELWEHVLELHVAGRDQSSPEPDEVFRPFARKRFEQLRALFRAGRGAWYVALAGEEVVGSCGIVVADGRGRFDSVTTAAGHRRRGICSRLVVEAAHLAADHHGAGRFVIAAEPGYHALGLYESLGFRRVERVHGVLRRPSAPDAHTPAAARASSGSG